MHAQTYVAVSILARVILYSSNRVQFLLTKLPFSFSGNDLRKSSTPNTTPPPTPPQKKKKKKTQKYDFFF